MSWLFYYSLSIIFNSNDNMKQSFGKGYPIFFTILNMATVAN